MSDLLSSGGGGGGGDDVAAHEAAADPHTGYLLESDAAVVKTGQANTYSTGAQSFASATSLVIPTAAAPTPTADGQIAYGTTQDRYVAGGAGGLTGSFPRVLSVTRPNQTLTNSTTSLQTFTSIFQIPANYIIPQRVLRCDIMFSWVSDASASTQIWGLRLDANTGVTLSAVSAPPNVTTHNLVVSYYIIGTAAPAAAAAVDFSVGGTQGLATVGFRATSAPTSNHATDGVLDVIPVLTFSTNTGGESLTLLNAIVTEWN